MISRRGLEIYLPEVKFRFEEALKEINKRVPKSIPGYKYI
jgi:hypothetical protein